MSRYGLHIVMANDLSCDDEGLQIYLNKMGFIKSHGGQLYLSFDPGILDKDVDLSTCYKIIDHLRNQPDFRSSVRSIRIMTIDHISDFTEIVKSNVPSR